MSHWKSLNIGDFLFERNDRFKPDDIIVSNLKRLEKIDFQGFFHIGDKSSNTVMILIKPGDFVISGINVTKGAMGIYEGKKDITATIHYSSYTFDENIINVGWFKRFLKSKVFIDLLKEQVKGGIKTEIKPKHILPLQIFLPDKKVQDEIVNHFENIEGEISDLATEITRQQTFLKKLRQSILQDAISGKLTQQWRKENPDVEPASQLLNRIKAEKDRLVKEKKIPKQKPIPPISDNEIPFELPDGWVWCRLGEIIYENPRNGYSPKAVDYETKVKTLKLGATTTGRFIDTEIKYIDEHIEDASYLWLKPGDILIQRSNSIDHVGVSVIYQGSEGKFIYPDLMMKIQPHNSINKFFLHKILLSSIVREYFRNNASGSQKSMPKINQDIVAKTLIPIPSINEQKIIKTRIEEIDNDCDLIEKIIVKSRQNSELLMQSVLKEAFEGATRSG
jgi:type I restriction enzyme, S subunit